jgi:hypothetical protein
MKPGTRKLIKVFKKLRGHGNATTSINNSNKHARKVHANMLKGYRSKAGRSALKALG